MNQILKIQEDISKVLGQIPYSSKDEKRTKFENALEDLAEVAINILDLPKDLVNLLDTKSKGVIFSFLGFVSVMEDMFYQPNEINEKVLVDSTNDLKTIYDKYWMFKKPNQIIQRLIEIGSDEYWQLDE